MGYGFHVKNGWHFKRVSNGDVFVQWVNGEKIKIGFTIDCETWISVVAAVCRDGENAFLQRLIEVAHRG